MNYEERLAKARAKNKWVQPTEAETSKDFAQEKTIDDFISELEEIADRKNVSVADARMLFAAIKKQGQEVLPEEDQDLLIKAIVYYLREMEGNYKETLKEMAKDNGLQLDSPEKKKKKKKLVKKKTPPLVAMERLAENNSQKSGTLSRLLAETQESRKEVRKQNTDEIDPFFASFKADLSDEEPIASNKPNIISFEDPFFANFNADLSQPSAKTQEEPISEQPDTPIKSPPRQRGPDDEVIGTDDEEEVPGTPQPVRKQAKELAPDTPEELRTCRRKPKPVESDNEVIRSDDEDEEVPGTPQPVRKAPSKPSVKTECNQRIKETTKKVIELYSKTVKQLRAMQDVPAANRKTKKQYIEFLMGV